MKLRSRVEIKDLQKLLNNLTELERKRAVLASKAAMESIGRQGENTEKNIIHILGLMDTGVLYARTGYKVKARTRDRKGHYAVIGQHRGPTLVVGRKRRNPTYYNHLIEFGTKRGVRAYLFVDKTRKIVNSIATPTASRIFKKYLGL